MIQTFKESASENLVLQNFGIAHLLCPIQKYATNCRVMKGRDSIGNVNRLWLPEENQNRCQTNLKKP